MGNLMGKFDVKECPCDVSIGSASVPTAAPCESPSEILPSKELIHSQKVMSLNPACVCPARLLLESVDQSSQDGRLPRDSRLRATSSCCTMRRHKGPALPVTSLVQTYE